jgi:hypothetical protein
MKRELDVIELTWSGPHTPEFVIQECVKPYDHGIYQICGTHSVLGPGALLYIGKAQDNHFAARISTHKGDYFDYEPNLIEIYLGRLGSRDLMQEDRWPQWDSEIDRAERLLISQCLPPYNSHYIAGPGAFEVETLLLNHCRRNRLPACVCSLSLTSAAHSEEWLLYGTERVTGGST